MEEIILEAQKRQDIGKGKVGRLRKKAFMPAIVYGEGKVSLSIQVVTKDVMGIIGAHRGESFVLKLKIKDGNNFQEKAVLIKEIQHNPVTDEITHIDFNEISLTKTIRVKVPLVAKGESIGVKQDGGVLDHVLWELEIECLPTQIPKAIDVDVANLKIGDSLHVKDLVVPQEIKVLNDKEATVLAVVMPTKEEAAPAQDEVAAEAKTEPEVIKEKKEKAEEAAEPSGGKGQSKEEKK